MNANDAWRALVHAAWGEQQRIEAGQPVREWVRDSVEYWSALAVRLTLKEEVRR